MDNKPSDIAQGGEIYEVTTTTEEGYVESSLMNDQTKKMMEEAILENIFRMTISEALNLKRALFGGESGKYPSQDMDEADFYCFTCRARKLPPYRPKLCPAGHIQCYKCLDIQCLYCERYDVLTVKIEKKNDSTFMGHEQPFRMRNEQIQSYTYTLHDMHATASRSAELVLVSENIPTNGRIESGNATNDGMTDYQACNPHSENPIYESDYEGDDEARSDELDLDFGYMSTNVSDYGSDIDTDDDMSDYEAGNQHSMNGIYESGYDVDDELSGNESEDEYFYIGLPLMFFGEGYDRASKMP
ncbi:hypothetical protein C0J52_26440 [Blattella germanica]|nr:hypothetical protein C0J52_26440 [Blattella germanica]